MVEPTIRVRLNRQIMEEFYSGYLYLDISNYYADENLDGFANWFRVQAQEERDHALLFLDYLLYHGERPELLAVGAPEGGFSNHREPLTAAFEHEKKVTAMIHEIYGAALEQKDYRALQFLDWFIKEQGEEEKSTEELIKRYDLFGKDAKSLYMLDAELKNRVYAAPTLVL